MPIVDGKTRLYGTLGDPIEHVASPRFATEAFRAAGVNALVVPIHVTPADLEVVMRGLKAIGNFDGFVVTLPHKVQAMAFVDRVLATGRRVGAINAIRRNADGSWTGDMFDGKGLVRALRDIGVDPAGANVMLLGAGGAGSAIADAIAQAGSASLDIFDLDAGKARALAEHIRENHSTPTAVKKPAAAGHQIIINATPIGMASNDELPMQLDGFDKPPVVVDIAIGDDGTRFLRAAKALGCQTVEGQAMVRAQMSEFLEFFKGGGDDRE
jgi:shikimate dehydrogenase